MKDKLRIMALFASGIMTCSAIADNVCITELNRIDRHPLSFEGKTFTGAFLMANGLELPYGHDTDFKGQNEWASRVLCLEEI